MATIGKIRERSGWVIGLIGIAMLGFIATDLLKNRLFFNGNSSVPKGIGVVFGEQIDPQSFSTKEPGSHCRRSQPNSTWMQWSRAQCN